MTVGPTGSDPATRGSLLRFHNYETCLQPRSVPRNPNRDRGELRSRCSRHPPRLFCVRSVPASFRDPMNQLHRRKCPAACDPSSSVCSNASTTRYHIPLSQYSFSFCYRARNFCHNLLTRANYFSFFSKEIRVLHQEISRMTSLARVVLRWWIFV